MAECPGEFGIHVEGEVFGLAGRYFAGAEAVVTHEPVGLVETVLADEWGGVNGEAEVGVGDGAEGGIVDAFKFVLGVEGGGSLEDGAVGGGGCADDHLGGLAGGGEACSGQWSVVSCQRRRTIQAVVVDAEFDVAHGGGDGEGLLLRGEAFEVRGGGEFDVGAESVGVFAGVGDEGGAGTGDGFEVDVAIEAVGEAEVFGDGGELLHGVVDGLHDARGEEKSFDVIAAVEVEGEVDDFVDGEAGAFDIGGNAVDAVLAIVDAMVGEEDLEKGDAAAIGSVGVANAGAVGVSHAAPAFAGARAPGTGGGAGGVVFGGVSEDAELFAKVHQPALNR